MVKKAIYICIFSTLVTAINIYAQNKAIADSCLKILSSGKPKDDSTRFNLMTLIAFNQTQPDSISYYSDYLIKQSTTASNSKYLSKGYYCKSIGLSKQSKNKEALEYLFLSINESRKVNDDKQISLSYAQIGSVYSALRNYKQSTKHYHLAINGLRKSKNNTALLPGTYMNLAGDYYSLNMRDSAVFFYNIADSLYASQTDVISAAYIKGNVGIIMAEQNNIEASRQKLQEACEILKTYMHYPGYISYKIWLSHLEMESNHLDHALGYVEECIDIAKTNNLPEQIRDSYEQLSSIYEAMSRYQDANAALKNYYAYRDSIINTETITKIANLRTEFEVGQKQAELDAMTEKEHFKTRLAWALSLGFAVVVVLLVAVYHNFRTNNRLARQLGNQKQQLETANHTKDRFFSVISHDLRGPIGSLGNLAVLAQAATQEGNAEEMKQFLSLLEQNTKNVEVLLDNLLHWSVSQKGAYQIHKEVVDINELIKGIIDIYLPIASAKGIELLYAPPCNGLTATIDVNSWAVILRNLINNALKFTHIGGKVEIKASLASNSLEIEVRDTGVGMDKQTKESLFTTPVNQPQWGTQNEKGMGIGLSLVKDFVELNQGTVYLESEVGKGTAFRVTVPV